MYLIFYILYFIIYLITTCLLMVSCCYALAFDFSFWFVEHTIAYKIQPCCKKKKEIMTDSENRGIQIQQIMQQFPDALVIAFSFCSSSMILFCVLSISLWINASVFISLSVVCVLVLVSSSRICTDFLA